jgi:hypothetical protein
MTTRDLLEQASLDALGLLDEQERAEYEASFRAADPEIQAQIRREQIRFADLTDLLPPVEAPAGLRARVLAAVRDAIAAVSSPRATGGAAGRIGGPAFAGRMIFNTAPVWRAACIGFATATVVLSVFFIWMSQEAHRIQSMITSDNIAEFLQQNAGPNALEILASENLRDYAFIPAAADYSALSARLLVDPDKGNAVLFCKNLPQINGSYRLVIESTDGSKHPVRFQNSGAIVSVPVSIDLKSLGRLVIEGPTGFGAREGEILRVDEV